MKGKKTIFAVVAFVCFCVSPAGAYEFECSQNVTAACGTDKLCQLQYFACCPVSQVHRQQDCDMCTGFWIDEKGECSESGENGNGILPAILMYLLG